MGDATDFCTVPSATQMPKAKISNGFLGMNFMPRQSLISKLSLKKCLCQKQTWRTNFFYEKAKFHFFAKKLLYHLSAENVKF